MSTTTTPKPKPKKRPDDHLVWKGSTFACLRCGSQYEMAIPAPIDVLVGASKGFSATHKKCRLDKERGLACSHCFAFGHDEKTCPQTVYRGDWRKWLAGPDTGISSETICKVLASRNATGEFTGDHVGRHFKDGIPYDPADFGRCHRLLHAIPGWRARIGEMRTVNGWASLVDAWDELETLYLAELQIGIGEAPRLYKRMYELRGEKP